MENRIYPIFLRRAIKLSQRKMVQGEGGPFGAVVARGKRLISIGWNRVTSRNDPTAHAEIMAIRHAARKLSAFHLHDCLLYTSCEPCPMCLAAAYWAQLAGIVYACNREEAAAIGFGDAFIYQQIALEPEKRNLPMRHLPMEKAGAVLQQWQQKENKVPY